MEKYERRLKKCERHLEKCERRLKKYERHLGKCERHLGKCERRLPVPDYHSSLVTTPNTLPYVSSTMLHTAKSAAAPVATEVAPKYPL